jgi:putative sigma-54 modulation protein
VRVQIAERHCDVPDEVLDRTQQQIDRLAKYQPRASAAEVVYSEEKLTRKIEVIIHIDGSEAVVAHADAPEFRAALDQAVDRLRRQLRKQRERRRDHKAPPLSKGVEAE